MFKSYRLLFWIAFSGVTLAGCKSQKTVTSQQNLPLAIERPIAIEDSIVSDTIPELFLIEPDSIEEQPVDSVVLLPKQKKDSIVIMAVGDIMLGTNFPEKYYLPPNQGYDMLAGVSQIFDGGDIVFGNLEGVLLDSGGTQKNCRNPKACYLFRSPEYMGTRLQEAGFNLMSVANNHAGDFGPEGRMNTAKVLDSLKIDFAGNLEQPWTIFEDDGIIYGFAAFSPNKGTPNINDLENAKNTVIHLDSLVDIVIISFHGGAEGKDYSTVPREHEYFYGEDRGDVYGFAHTLVDAGADVIFGHGPHIPRAIEVYKQRFIAYSLGNFATYGRFNLRGDNALAPVAKILVNNDGSFRSGQIISCIQTGRGVPQIDTLHRAASRIRELTKKDMSEVEISIDQSGFISYLHN